MKKTYYGSRGQRGLVVTMQDGQPLPDRRDLVDHSNGFECGYGGSGPAQLALALLADLCGDEFALAHYQQFKWAVIARLPREGWALTLTEEGVKEKIGQQIGG